MARGPLPNPNARRRNAPTIPTTQLPAGGRKGAAPKCPYQLAASGKAWWKWAWSTPQAHAWDVGALYVVARRAQLEDELAALGAVASPELADAIGVGEDEIPEQVAWVISALKSHASGSNSVMREMREIDGKLGLTPKALADLRWTITADVVDAAARPKTTKTAAAKSSRRLRAV